MDKVKFVQSVKFYCNQKGVKPTVACREAGVGTSFINNIEARGQVPSVEKVQQLAQYLGVTTSELLQEVPMTAIENLLYTQAEREAERAKKPPLDLDEWFRGHSSRFTAKEVDMVEAYRRADERSRAIVDLTLEPFSKEGSGTDG